MLTIRRTVLVVLLALAPVWLSACVRCEAEEPATRETIDLPAPALKGTASLEEALAGRRSRRRFGPGDLERAQVAQLLWAAQGVNRSENGRRTAPSAGALYPLELYVVDANGVFRYLPGVHELEERSVADKRRELAEAALGQGALRRAPVVFVIAAVYTRTSRKYGVERGARYVHMEAGHAAQNLLLQATALGLDSVPIGAFHDAEVQAVLGLPGDHAPLYLIPVGRPEGGE